LTIGICTPESGFLQDFADVIRLFLGDVNVAEGEGEATYTHVLRAENGIWTDMWRCGASECALETPMGGGDALEVKRLRKRAAKRALYSLMKRTTGARPPWGSLTGIRPTRLMYEAMEEGLSPDEAQRRMTDVYDVTEDKASLLREIIDMQTGLRRPEEGTFDLYMGIPFCTTRCAYCSFSSGELGNGSLTEPYTRALLREIALCREIVGEMGLRLRAGYVGGGTPTAISREQLRRILDAAMEAFPNAVEWTVEAGRPDTIDRDKLRMLADMRVNRISVNPQSFSDETLRRIGRAHTGADTLRAFAMAREEGFHHINMDIIAALPGEELGDFSRTLDVIEGLDPESVTVHSLAIKRSSRLHEQLTKEGGHSQVDAAHAGEMIDLARKRLEARGWMPYYLYRQKYMAGNLENVGYAKRGRACLYNIGNMEETANVLALGAGAITKWLFDRQRRIERAPNVKNIEEYIARVDEMARRKREILYGKVQCEK